ncbi:MAG: ATP-binding protein [bacterium]|nr:ATP-binding protein [bacterium]
MKNPFVYGGEVSGSAFCNREKEIQELIRDIQQGENIIIFSPRRYGKTSLIKRVLEMAGQMDILTVYIDLYPAITKQKFVEVYARALAKSIKGKTETVYETLRGLLPRLVPKVVLKGDEGPDFEFSYDKTADTLPLLDDLLAAVRKQAEKKGQQGLVVFDEFQEIANYEDDEIERKMRSIFQTHREISYVFMGSKKHIIFDLFSNPNRPFYKSGKHFPLGKIEKEVLADFVSSKFREGEIEITREMVSEIVDLCEAHPYYVQFLSHILWEEGEEKAEIGREELDTALQKLLKRESGSYITLWDTLSQKQRQIMSALSQEEKAEVFSSKFLQKYNLGAASSLQKTLKSLMEKDLIEKEDGVYVMADVFFKRWIRTLEG